VKSKTTWLSRPFYLKGSEHAAGVKRKQGLPDGVEGCGAGCTQPIDDGPSQEMALILIRTTLFDTFKYQIVGKSSFYDS
jgi:hypothetical protein